MHWLIPVTFRIFVGHLIAPWLIKTNAIAHSRVQRFALQYFFCAIIGAFLALALNQLKFSAEFVAIVAIGFANGFAAFLQWKAMAISLTRDSIYTWGDDIISMVLGFTFLAEGAFLTGQIVVGIALSLFAMGLFIRHAYKKHLAGATDAVPVRFYLYIAGYSFTWGVTTFLIRYLTLEGVSIGTFISGWYLGALALALIVLATYREPDEIHRFKSNEFGTREVVVVALLAMVIFSALALHFWALAVAPLIIVTPIFLVSEMVGPALIGLVLFNEGKGFDLVEWSYLGIGIIGALIIGFGFVV
jgi:hypothetical protein